MWTYKPDDYLDKYIIIFFNVDFKTQSPVQNNHLNMCVQVENLPKKVSNVDIKNI